MACVCACARGSVFIGTEQKPGAKTRRKGGTEEEGWGDRDRRFGHVTVSRGVVRRRGGEPWGDRCSAFRVSRFAAPVIGSTNEPRVWVCLRRLQRPWTCHADRQADILVLGLSLFIYFYLLALKSFYLLACICRFLPLWASSCQASDALPLLNSVLHSPDTRLQAKKSMYNTYIPHLLSPCSPYLPISLPALPLPFVME